MSNRLDISDIRPLGSYAAKQCPVRAQLDVLRPTEPAPPTPFQTFQFHEGNLFEASVFETLVTEERGDWVVIPVGADRSAREEMTLFALTSGARVVVGGRLPEDGDGRRVGEPDLLVWAGDGYAPVDVKNHSTIDPDDESAIAVSSLDRPFPDATSLTVGSLRKHRGDALQLAHYAAMLAACDLAASQPIGGIIGREGVVVWYDLTTPMWKTPAKSDGRKTKTRSTLEIYDFEFGFRCDIAATALLHQRDPQVDLLVEPMRSAECTGCPWREHCEPQLEAGFGDTSLLPRMRYPHWQALRAIGIRDRFAVRSLHYPTANLAAEKVDLDTWLDLARDVPASTPLRAIWPRATTQTRILCDHGFTTAGDLAAGLDPTTAQLSGSWVPEVLVGAHAVLGDRPVYLRPGVRQIDVPRADIEIDIDMENTFDGVYMWGVFVTDRSDTGLVETGYRAFHTWEPLTEAIERTVFGEFWLWLHATLDVAHAGGATVRTYVWHEPAENAQLRRVTRGDDALRSAVNELIESDTWVDLRQVFVTQLTTGESTGLKAIAPLAGFAWDVEDPGGAMSMVYHGIATGEDPEEAKTHREWLLDYNRGDVMATAAIRGWLDSTDFPELDLSQLSAE